MSDTPFSFPWPEWNEALEHFLSAMENPLARENAYLTTGAYFPSRYPDPAESEWKRLRFEKAMKWLDENMEQFDFGKAGVVGKESGLISKEVYLVLWNLFAGIEDDLLNEAPPQGHVKSQVERLLQR